MKLGVVNDNIDIISEQHVVTLIDNLFDAIAYVDPEILRYNIGLASEGGMPTADRVIRLELANYLMSHFAYIYTGLIIDYRFRDTFIEAIQLEILLDTVDDEQKAQIRKDMVSETASKPSKGNYIINLATYSEAASRKINEKIYKGFEAFKPYNNAIDLLAEKLNQRDKIEIGFCVSNFMYCVRALAKNGKFADYVKFMIKQVEKTLSEED